ncbi:MAG: peptidoglycan DD-metalloendopeptidase family protein [Bacteroidales bacterium]|nr:peptidoglycan DD-metalloendopeptidase family protein [Bacteroidales bacterium]
MNEHSHKPHSIFPFMLAIIFIGISFYGLAQEKKEELKKNKKELEKEIEYTNKLIKKTQQSKKLSMNKLVLLRNKIAKREELIATINTEINYYNFRIQATDDTIQQLSSKLGRLKEEYAKLIYHAFKNRDAYNRLMFIFSAEDFNQAYQRLKYFKQYSDYRKTQVELIKQTQALLNLKIDQLKNQKQQKIALLRAKEHEKKRLKSEVTEKNQTIRELTQKEKDLLAELKKKKEAAGKLQEAIEDIIAEEMRKARESAKERGAVESESAFALTANEMELSKMFSTNKGKLPWPAEDGIISSTFGEHQHPVLKYVKTKNNGVDIQTSKGATARAVFEGVVTRVMSVPRFNNVVIIRHGEYLTVYSNLSVVFVAKGDQVKTRQSIGMVYTDSEVSKTELHFEIWKGNQLLNPQQWISRRN